jgi:hypothetical protein
VGAVVIARVLRRYSVVLLLALAACATTDQQIDVQTYAPVGPALARVAVIPFYAHRLYEGSSRLGGVSPELATERVAQQVTEAVLAEGIEIVPIDEIANAFENVTRSTAVIDSQIYAEGAGNTLGATSVLVGEVLRYRDARGATTTGRHPASVAFQVTLYEAPDGFKLWSARYDYTQPIPQEKSGSDLHDAALLKRWLTAHEIARRGADAIAQSLADAR